MKNFDSDSLKKKHTLTTMATLYPLAFAVVAASSSRDSLVLQRFARARLDAPRKGAAALLPESGQPHAGS